MPNGNSSFGKRRDGSAGVVRTAAPSPNPTGEGERISVKHVAVGNIISVGVGAFLLAIFAVGSVLSGAAKPAPEWSEALSIAIFVLSALVAGYATARRAGQAFLMHGLLSALLIIGLTIFGILPFKGFIRFLIDVLEITATIGGAIAGGALARAQSRAGIDLPWWLLGRSFLAVLAGFLITIVSLIISVRLGAAASVIMPAFSLAVGIFATWGIAPPGARRTVASIYLGLIIAAAAMYLANALLTHTVKMHHWFNFLVIGAAWFFTRKIWRDPEFT